MKKKFYDLTLAEAESLIKCRDENGEYLCGKGCRFSVKRSCGNICSKHAFLSSLFDCCDEKGLVCEDDDWSCAIDFESEVTDDAE